MPNVDQAIAAYMKLRNKKDAIEAQVKEDVKVIKDKMSKLEAFIKLAAEEQGVTSFKTAHGTAFLTTKDYARVADWDATLEFILANEAFDMLEKRVSKLAVTAYMKEKGDIPPGINYGTSVEVNVRKPAARVDDDE
jgi:hypothetical protein